MGHFFPPLSGTCGGGAVPAGGAGAMTNDVTRDEVCVSACAEAWRGDGETFASGMGTIPMLAARLARVSIDPDLLVSDGEAYFVAGDLPLGAPADSAVIEGWIPFRAVFDTLWGGLRHVMLGASQIDRWGNQNIACIGPWGETQGPAARCARRARQHRQSRHELLDPQPLDPGVRRTGRHGFGPRLSAGRGGRWGCRRSPRNPSGGDQPRRVRLRDARSPYAAS